MTMFDNVTFKAAVVVYIAFGAVYTAACAAVGFVAACCKRFGTVDTDNAFVD
jgi:hypothetical protein